MDGKETLDAVRLNKFYTENFITSNTNNIMVVKNGSYFDKRTNEERQEDLKTSASIPNTPRFAYWQKVAAEYKKQIDESSKASEEEEKKKAEEEKKKAEEKRIADEKCKAEAAKKKAEEAAKKAAEEKKKAEEAKKKAEEEAKKKSEEMTDEEKLVKKMAMYRKSAWEQLFNNQGNWLLKAASKGYLN